MGKKDKWKNKSGSKTYFAWRNMKSRCYNTNHVGYKNYGARGIVVCEEWLNNYDKFFEDMGEAKPSMSLDRIDSNGPYCKENCKWSTVGEQLNNQRRNHVITYNNKTQNLNQWAKELNIRIDTLANRIKRMPLEKALVSGYLKQWKHGTRAGYESHHCKCELCKKSNTERHKKQREKRKQKDKT